MNYYGNNAVSATSCSGNNHVWVFAGGESSNFEMPEGFPCSCGRMEWHKDKCPTCGSNIVEPIERKEKN